jgi:predicted P-loop ATPase
MAGISGDLVAMVAAALGGAKRTGNGWDCQCPAHKDRTASLSLSLGNNGKLVWKCHAGCTQEAVRDQLEARGLLPAKGRPGGASGGRRIVATYDYHDEAGELVFQVCRFDPKDFRQRRRQRAGDDPAKCSDGWCWNVKGVRQVPYRLPAIVAAIAAGQDVWVVEGEKDADALARLGLAATCNAGGAGKWRSSHAKCLRGAGAIICPDNDEAGRKHVDQVAETLAGVARRVRVLELPGLPDKGDVSDWLATGHGLAELLALAEVADEVKTAAAKPAAAAPREAAPEWRAKLIKWPNGQPKPLLANAQTALCDAPEWQGVLAFNGLRRVVEMLAPPPWAPRNGVWQRRPWSDNDDVRVASWLQYAGVEVGHTIAHAAVAEAAERNTYHPVREYLAGLTWDGIERIRHFAQEWLGCVPKLDDEPMIQAVSACMLVAAVARAMQPGCKVDNVPILEGKQGARKSTAIRTLFGAEWFTDDLAELGSKDCAQQIAGTWCAEIADLVAMGKADVEKIKAFTARRVDRYRPSYGRNLIDAPRQAVMWGTTNSAEYLKDDTGARRFWPIACGHIDIAKIERDRDQLWAEAFQAFQAGDPWWLVDGQILDLASKAQQERQVSDAWDERIEAFVYNKDDVSVGEVLQYGLVVSPGDWRQSDQIRIGRFLTRSGWKRRYVGQRGRQKWRYFRPDPAPDEQLGMEYEETGL